MSPANELLARLQALGIKLWVEEDGLRFRAPKGVMTETLSAEVRALKPELMVLLDSSVATCIPNVFAASDYALSHAQRRMWILAQLEGGSAAYNIPLHMLLDGELDRGALAEALTRLVQRHESLRTTFTVQQGEPRQVIHEQSRFVLGYRDLRSELDPEGAAKRLGQAESSQPFELENGPLFRATLLCLGPARHVLLFTMHHIVSDGVSIGVLARDVSRIYAGLRGGAGFPAPLRIQYRDFAQWQNKLLQHESADEHRAYWHEKLCGEIPALDLPTDFTRPVVQTFEGHELSFVLESDVVSGLMVLGRKNNASLFMMLAALLKVLLYRYTGQEDIVVGCPIAGRNHADLEDQIGLFLNTLPLRDRVQGDLTFEECLASVRKTATEAYDHQVYPFDRLVEELHVTRQLNRSALFDVMMVLQNQDDSGFTFAGVSAVPFFDHPGTSKYDLTWSFKAFSGRIFYSIEYNTSLFLEERIARMGRHLAELARHVVKEPGAKVGQLNLLPEEERKCVVEEWNATTKDYPVVHVLHSHFEDQARKNPDAVALVFRGETLSYHELNRRSNQLAWFLRSRGVGQNMLVGVCAERSIEMVVALYGILKAGGAYVPLDPEYPAERLKFMLEDSGVRLLLTQEKLRARIGEKVKAERIMLDTGWPALAKNRVDDPEPVVGPDDLAYMMYTSGSTGRPKGALNTHRAICNQLIWMQDEYGLKTDDVVLQKTPFSFDVSVWEFFWPLMNGAKLVIAEPGGHRDGGYLKELVREQKITTLHFVPPMLQMFLEEEALEHCDSLRRVISIGEALSFELQERFYEKMGAELHNLYGPTEAAVAVTSWRCPRNGNLKMVPIGKPMANIRIYILDRGLKPVPIGVAGELHIGGVGVCRGYHQRPELTAEKFIPDPFDGSGRLYKTGDLARHLPDGNIEYLGRMDNQVKVRGFRVELGEIEEALRQLPGVADAVVVVQEEAGDRCLAGYVATAGLRVDVPALKALLKVNLPAYMIPSSIVVMDKLPLTPNGKVDRKALPKPEHGRRATRDVVLPCNALEQRICTVWQEVLGVPGVSVNDNFFEIGGHSLKAMQVVFRLQRELGFEMSLLDMFKTPTVAELAKVAMKCKEASAEAGVSSAGTIAAATADELAMLE